MTRFGWLCAMLDTPEKERALEQRHKLAEDDHAAWLRSFDEHGRYYDPATGFWESINSEMRNDDGTWETITEEEASLVA